MTHAAVRPARVWPPTGISTAEASVTRLGPRSALPAGRGYRPCREDATSLHVPESFLLAALLAGAAGCLTKPVNSRVMRAVADGGPSRTDGRTRPSGETDGPSFVDAAPTDAASPGEPGGACERGEQCESGYCVDGRLLQRRLQRQLRELQPARPVRRMCPGARRTGRPARGCLRRQVPQSSLRAERLLQRPRRLSPSTRPALPAASHRLLGAAHLPAGRRMRRRRHLRQGRAHRVHALSTARPPPAGPAAWPTPTACRPTCCAAGRVRPARQRPGLHRQRSVPEQLLRRRRLLRKRLRRPLPVLRLARQPRLLPAGAGRRARPARRRRRHRPGPGLPGPGDRQLRHQRPLRRPRRLPALRKRHRLPGGPLRDGLQRRVRRVGLHGRQLPLARGRELRPLPRLQRRPLPAPNASEDDDALRIRVLLRRRRVREAGRRAARARRTTTACRASARRAAAATRPAIPAASPATSRARAAPAAPRTFDEELDIDEDNVLTGEPVFLNDGDAGARRAIHDHLPERLQQVRAPTTAGR